MNFDKLLEDGFANSHDTETTRLEYLSDYIFDFTTYDSEKAEEFAMRAVEVAEVINNGHTFDYIKDPVQYRWYLLMVNMPFFAGRLEWGTSVRGAWWVHEPMTYSSCGLWDGERQVHEMLTLEREQWRAFIAAIVTFAKAEPA